MNYGIILIAGSGTRFDDKLPKQFTLVKGKPLYFYALETFINNDLIDEVLLVVNEKYLNHVKDEVTKKNFTKKVHFVTGGDTRVLSTYNALLYLENIAKDYDNVLFQDGSRPLVTDEIIARNVEALKENNAVTTAIKVTSTMVSSLDHKTINYYLNRNELYDIQTPQSFKFKTILKAYKEALKGSCLAYTDDSSVAFASGNEVVLVEGSPLNFKITTKKDLQLLEKILG